MLSSPDGVCVCVWCVPDPLQCHPAKESEELHSHPGFKPGTFHSEAVKASTFDLSASEPSLSCAHQKPGDIAAAAAAAAAVGGETDRFREKNQFEQLY